MCKMPDIGQMFTPPKSKTPWQAMTRGSTGGWAKGIEPWGPLITAAAGAVPGFGPALATGMGAAGMTNVGGFRGTDYGWGENIGSTILGGVSGYLAGQVGKGVATGVNAAMSPTGTVGAGSGAYSVVGPGGKMITAPASKFAAGFGQSFGTGLGNANLFAGGARPGSMAAGGGATGLVKGGAGAGAGGFKNLIGPALATGAGIGSYAAKQPEFDYQTTQQRMGQIQGVLEKYMGEAAGQLPAVAAEEYIKQIKTPLGQLYPVEQDARWGRMEPLINDSWDKRDAQIKAQFAQAGGTGSSDEVAALHDARQMRTQELTQARNEIESDLFRQQVYIKQDALARAAQQGQFDMELALELTKLTGRDQELLMAIETNNYDTFQEIMANVFQLGGQMSLEAFNPNVSMGR